MAAERRRRGSLSFAAANEPRERRELRTLLMGEAQHWLEVWEATRDERAAGRLFQALDTVKMLVGGEP